MKLLKDLRNIFNDEPIIISLVFISLITSVFLLFCKFGDIVTFFERVFAALQHLLIGNTAVGIVVLLSLVLFIWVIKSSLKSTATPQKKRIKSLSLI